jgi:hypothetical protein
MPSILVNMEMGIQKKLKKIVFIQKQFSVYWNVMLSYLEIHNNLINADASVEHKAYLVFTKMPLYLFEMTTLPVHSKK